MLRSLLLFSILVCITALACFAVRNIFSVKEIMITSSVSKDSIRGYESYYSSFLPLVSETELQKSLIKENPIIAKVEVEKIYPNKLSLTVGTVGPAVTIKVADEYVLIAANGRVLQKVKTKPEKLPEIFYYQELFKEQIKSGDLLGFKDLQIAIKFIDILKSLGYKVVNVDINSFYMIRLVLEDSREILVTTEKDIQKQEYQVRSILRQFKVDGTNFKHLDVRFDKPVMTK